MVFFIGIIAAVLWLYRRFWRVTGRAVGSAFVSPPPVGFVFGPPLTQRLLSAGQQSALSHCARRAQRSAVFATQNTHTQHTSYAALATAVVRLQARLKKECKKGDLVVHVGPANNDLRVIAELGASAAGLTVCGVRGGQLDGAFTTRDTGIAFVIGESRSAAVEALRNTGLRVVDEEELRRWISEEGKGKEEEDDFLGVSPDDVACLIIRRDRSRRTVTFGALHSLVEKIQRDWTPEDLAAHLVASLKRRVLLYHQILYGYFGVMVSSLQQVPASDATVVALSTQQVDEINSVLNDRFSSSFFGKWCRGKALFHAETLEGAPRNGVSGLLAQAYWIVADTLYFPRARASVLGPRIEAIIVSKSCTAEQTKLLRGLGVEVIYAKN